MSIIVLVVLLRRDELTPTELRLLQTKYPGKVLEFHRTDPRDALEHVRDCERIKPDVVFLPLEKPLPSLAMEAGFPHVAVTWEGLLRELCPLEPRFKFFEPRSKEAKDKQIFPEPPPGSVEKLEKMLDETRGPTIHGPG